MCSTVDAFNTTLRGFLEELVHVFPDEPGIGKIQLFLGGFDIFLATNKRAAMDLFLESMAPHAALLNAKDAKIFKRVELPGGVSLKDLWKKASDGTRDATWQYLQMLYLLASTAAAVPPEMLASIESMAAEYAGKVQSGEMDMSAVTSMLLGGVGGAGGALGNLDFAALLGGSGSKKQDE